MSNELIEKVARALYAIEWSELGGPYDEQDEIDKTYWMRGATAAVNLVLEAAAEEMAKGDDGHDWSPEGAAAAIRRMKVDANG